VGEYLQETEGGLGRLAGMLERRLRGTAPLVYERGVMPDSVSVYENVVTVAFVYASSELLEFQMTVEAARQLRDRLNGMPLDA
jgi:hypothetical protein